MSVNKHIFVVQMQELGKESLQLQVVHPASADLIAAKQAEIGMLWEGLKHKVRVTDQ